VWVPGQEKATAWVCGQEQAAAGEKLQRTRAVAVQPAFRAVWQLWAAGMVALARWHRVRAELAA